MIFDREKLEDEHIKMHNIDLSAPPKTMTELFASARNYRTNADQVYTLLTHTIYAEFPQYLYEIKEYTNADDFNELMKLISETSDQAQLDEYRDALKNLRSVFRTEGNKFNNKLKTLIKTLKEDCRILELNLRSDLTSGAYFYGRIEEAMSIRGKQIEEMANVIKVIYISPITELKNKIKKYNEKIDSYLDPHNSFEAFMKALPTADEFASLTKFSEKKPDAQVEAMKAAYSVAIKGINYIGEQIANVADMEERRKCQDELSKLMASYDAYKEKHDTVLHEYELVRNLVIILNGMSFFADAGNALLNQLGDSLSRLEDYLKNNNVSEYYFEILHIEKILQAYLA